MAFYIQSLGEIVILAIIVVIMFGVDVNASTTNNNWGLSVPIAFATGAWLLLAIPWFIKEKRRARQEVRLISGIESESLLTKLDSSRKEHYQSASGNSPMPFAKSTTSNSLSST
jgi:hypothetical protein